MSGDISQFLEEQKLMILEDKKRLDLQVNDEKENCDNGNIQNNKPKQSIEELKPGCVSSTNENQTLPFVEALDLSSKRDSNDVTLEEKKQAFIDKLVNAENPFTNRSDESWRQGQCAMLRYGEYSPNNPQVRGAAPASVPFLGLGEYEQRRNYFLQKQRTEYLQHLATRANEIKEVSKSILPESRIIENSQKLSNHLEKSVQTDLKNIHSELIQYGLQCNNSPEKELSPRPGGIDNYYKQNNRNLAPFRVDQRLTSAQNALLKQDMDKPKSILSNRRTGSPRERLLSDLYGSSAFTESFTNSSYHPSLAEELERERIKREVYQQELRAQIEEKRRAREVRDELELAEREAENSRLERQLARLREERAAEERRGRKEEQMRRHSEDLLRRKQELQSRHSFRKHTDSESSLRNNPSEMASKQLSHYSPPVSRRNPPYTFNIPSTSVFSEPTARYNPNRFDSYHRKDTLNRMDSLNSYEPPPSRYNNTFSRFDSLSRIDSLTHRIESMNFRDSLSERQRRHSATQQDLSAMTRRSPRLQRRNSSGRFEDSLPTPQLKRSPVARELRNAIPCKSDASKRLEDTWQFSSVQKNSMDLSDSLRDGQSRSILTQLGAIRMQLQQEQFRMDETLRKRGITQSKAVDFH